MTQPTFCSLSRQKHTKLIFYLSIPSLVIILILALICPIRFSDAQAADCTPGSPECGTGYSSFQTNVAVAPTISVSTQTRVELDIKPTSTGSFASTITELQVATNNTSGYSLFMSVDDPNGHLVSTDKTNSAVIKPLSAPATLNNFPANSWGYSLNNDAIYQAVPTSMSSAIKTLSSTAYRDTYNLNIGTAIDTTLPAGQYTGTVTVAAVANPMVVTSLQQLTYMQDITVDICANSAEHATKQLIDIRDGNYYWVTKMKDGNCWMSQDLALDITTAGLSASNTDITTDWNTSSAYPPIATASSIAEKYPAMKAGDMLSFNLGKYVDATPGYSHLCQSPAAAVLGGVISIMYNETFDACYNAGFVNVSGPEWSPTFTAQQGSWTFPDGTTYTGLITVDPEQKTYDAHYLFGHYYNFMAVTAGSSANAVDEIVLTSICPKGWQLPDAIVDGMSETKTSFNHLYITYQYLEPGSIHVGNTPNDLSEAPFYYTRAGYVSPVVPGVVRTGSLTSLATRLAGIQSPTIRAYSAWISPNGVNAATSTVRTDSTAIRCLAPGQQSVVSDQLVIVKNPR